jgi:Rha family phage regulatory protein
MQLVIAYKKQVSTTSLLVAEKFEKRHDDVLKAIRQLDCSLEFRARHFADSSYKSKQNKEMPMVIMTRDGFTMLVMSFTGSVAAKFKEEFIEEFNRMEKVLQETAAPIFLATYQTRILSEPTKSCPDTHWSIFDESHSIMLFVEKHLGSVSQFDLVDGSIGQRWSKYRENKEWAEVSSTYMHEYNDVRGSRESKCYKYSEIEHFRKWLKHVYRPAHLQDYLESKYAREKNIMMLDRVRELLPKLLRAS